MERKYKTKSNSTDEESEKRREFLGLFSSSPIVAAEKIENLPLFLNRQTLTNLLFMDELYQQIIPVNGSIFEFGVRWGKNLALFENFRGIYEPFNYSRKMIGFDTFEGFPSVDKKDGGSKKGEFAVSENYEKYLSKVLDYHESESPISHIRKYSLIKGDASKTLPQYLKDHPETIVALAYFDFDIYKPTKECLKSLLPYLTKGSMLAFDELNYAAFPGETVALREVLGTNNIRLRRSKFSGHQSYAVVGD